MIMSLSSKKIKAGSSFSFVRHDKIQSSYAGYDSVKARGIFGKYHEYTEEEKARIKLYKEMKKNRANQKPIKPSVHIEQVTDEQEQYCDNEEAELFKDALKDKQTELSKLGLNLVGFKKSNGELTTL